MEVGVYGVHFPPFELATGPIIAAAAAQTSTLLSRVKGVASAVGSGATTLVNEGLSH